MACNTLRGCFFAFMDAFVHSCWSSQRWLVLLGRQVTSQLVSVCAMPRVSSWCVGLGGHPARSLGCGLLSVPSCDHHMPVIQSQQRAL